MKKINKLSYEEFTTLLKKNKMLFNRAYEHAEETAYFWADDLLRNIPKNIYYEFDYCTKRFDISVFDYELYHYISNLDKDYCLFEDGATLLKKIDRAICLYDKQENQYYYNISDKNIEKIEKRLNELSEEIETEIANAFYDFSYSMLDDDEFIIEEAFESGIFDDFEIDDGFKAYQTITKIYE
jgi:hypothetical protein